MTDLRKAAEMALEALESWQKTCLDCGRASEELGRATAPIQALRQALAQPEHKPEKEVTITCSCGAKFYTPLDELIKQLQEDKSQDFPKRFDTHPTPPKRDWVGLTDEDKEKLDEEYGDDMLAHLDAIEAKLKEKNT